MMSLCFSGCSFTYGGGLEQTEQRYSRIVSDHYGVPDNNISICGASNDDIVKRTILYLEENTVDIMVIQFTFTDRCQWLDHRGRIHDWKPSMKTNKPSPRNRWYRDVYNKYVGLENAYKNMNLFDLYCKSRKQKYIPLVAELTKDYDLDCHWKKLYKSNLTRVYPTGLFPIESNRHPNAEENKEMAKIVIGKIDELTV